MGKFNLFSHTLFTIKPKLLIRDIEKAANFWVPGFTSIFIDSIDNNE